MKDMIINNLWIIPNSIQAAEETLLAKAVALNCRRAQLADAEAALALDPERVNGKNAEQRAAQIRQLTAQERADVDAADIEVRQAQIALNLQQNEFKAALALARLVGGDQ